MTDQLRIYSFSLLKAAGKVGEEKPLIFEFGNWSWSRFGADYISCNSVFIQNENFLEIYSLNGRYSASSWWTKKVSAFGYSGVAGKSKDSLF